MLTHEAIAQCLNTAFSEAKRTKALPASSSAEIVVERPQDLQNGDFASNLPLRLARSAGLSPMEIAGKLLPFIPANEAIEEVWAAPPGFLNFSLKKDWLQQQATVVNEAGMEFGNSTIGSGKRVQVEFVSVNPTGPIHVGHPRGGVLGSTLANVLMAAGYDVTREYYVNDAGTQMEAFYNSLYVRYAQAMGQTDIDLPATGYQGQYVIDLAEEIAQEFGNTFLDKPKDDAIKELGAIGLTRMLDAIRADMESLGVTYDVWFSERALYENHQYEVAMKRLHERGFTVERDGATWFTSSTLGEDKDNVLVRSSGQPTYFAADVAYHYNKFVEREFDRVIDVWGADHQGHVQRMKSVVGALGADPDQLTIIIYQLVTLKRSGETMRVSKRSGDLVTLRELLEEVGPDACRFFFLSRAAESQMEFDLALATKASNDNPVYYVQYAHARVSGILRLAEERAVSWADGDVGLLDHEAELRLIRKMIVLPELVDTIAETLAPHQLTHYAIELATAIHWFYEHCRVFSDDMTDENLAKARLQLCHAAKVVLGRTLSLMGMTAPEKM